MDVFRCDAEVGEFLSLSQGLVFGYVTGLRLVIN